MTTLYDACKEGMPAFILGGGLFRANEGELAGQVLQFAGVSCDGGKDRGLVCVFVPSTGRLKTIPYDISELVKYKRVALNDLTPEEKKALDERVSRYREMDFGSS